MVTRFKHFNIAGHYCKQSGEKSTSWGNTLLTHLFMNLVAALHVTSCDVNETVKLLQQTTFTELYKVITGDAKPLSEGDDNSLPSNFNLEPAILMAASLMGFKATL
jgi:hypothetical protein